MTYCVNTLPHITSTISYILPPSPFYLAIPWTLTECITHGVLRKVCRQSRISSQQIRFFFLSFVSISSPLHHLHSSSSLPITPIHSHLKSRPGKAGPVPVNISNSRLLINEAAPIPLSLLPAESSTTPLLFSPTARRGAARTKEYGSEEVADYGCPHEAEVVFTEGGGVAVSEECVATFDVCGATRSNIVSGNGGAGGGKVKDSRHESSGDGLEEESNRNRSAGQEAANATA